MNQLTRAAKALIVIAGLAATMACDEKLRDVTGPTPNLTPTFASIEREIFNTTDANGRVACVQCHTDQGRTPPAGMVLLIGRAYASIVNQPSSGKPGAIRIIPGDPDNSYLVQKLEGAPGIVGLRMPRTGGPYLTPGQMLVIRRWIQLGARND